MPWDASGRYVLQSITSSSYATQVQGAGSQGTETVETNQVCVLDLAQVGDGPGGVVYEVTAADCEDANELECSSSCSASVGWVLTIPGGVELIAATSAPSGAACAAPKPSRHRGRAAVAFH